MAKGSKKQSERASQALLAEAMHEVASAIRREKRQEKRIEIGKHLMTLGNLAGSALIFGQAFSGFPLDLRIALAGLLALVLLYVLAVFVMRGGDQK